MFASVQFKVGDLVVFGRFNGERTLARIVKLNPKRAKVVTLEVRGHGAGSAIGTTWNVPYGSLSTATDKEIQRKQEAARASTVATAPPRGEEGFSPERLAEMDAEGWPHPIGLRIANVRPMTLAEMDAEGWSPGYMSSTPMVFVLSDGTLIYASRDSEGNGPGVLFGKTPDKGAVAFA